MGGPQGQPQQPYFQYSQCNGKKKALCVSFRFNMLPCSHLLSQIGINYFNTSSELGGCINDANNMQRFLCSAFGPTPSVHDLILLQHTLGTNGMI